MNIKASGIAFQLRFENRLHLIKLLFWEFSLNKRRRYLISRIVINKEKLRRDQRCLNLEFEIVLELRTAT